MHPLIEEVSEVVLVGRRQLVYTIAYQSFAYSNKSETLFLYGFHRLRKKSINPLNNTLRQEGGSV